MGVQYPHALSQAPPPAPPYMFTSVGGFLKQDGAGENAKLKVLK